MTMSQHEEGSTRLLPDDVLAEVLRRLAPRGVATSRCVCRAWCALIDGRHLLRRDLVPLSLAGLFIRYNELLLPELFHRPSVDFTDYSMPRSPVLGHCNGVLLLYNRLLNPAARWSMPLPELPPQYFIRDMCLVFDPAASVPPQVFLIPCLHFICGTRRHRDDSAAFLESEWPPSPCPMNVFSTLTGRWTERLFSREGEAAATVDYLLDDRRGIHPDRLPSAYWRGALYGYCETYFVMRISLSDDTYRVIPQPSGIEMCDCPEVHLGRSEKGVYLTLIDDDGQLLVWILDESSSRMEWVLKHKTFFGTAQMMSLYYSAEQVNGPWVFENANRQRADIIEAPVEQESEWNSDDEGITNTDQDRVDEHDPYRFYGILGIHPYKDIIFLYMGGRLDIGLAYLLNTSKLESLGNVCPINYYYKVIHPSIESCFPYTPCKMAE